MIWQGHTVYIDTLISVAALCFAVDFLLLWATSKVSGILRAASGLAIGAAFGTVYFILYILSDALSGPYYGLLKSWPVIVIVSAVMLHIALAPLSLRSFLQAAAYYYFIALSAGGAGLAAQYALGWGVPLQLITSIAAILIVAEMGWGVVQKSLWQRLYHLPLKLTLFGETVTATALLDTGNRLKDPLSGGGVIIVELDVIKRVIPEPLVESLEQMSGGDLQSVSRLLYSSRWSSRFRIIPFRSLGRENGILVGFRPDEAVVIFEGEKIVLEGVTIGIYDKKLDAEGGYNALLHPDVLRAIRKTSTSGHFAQQTTSKGERPHASTM